MDFFRKFFGFSDQPYIPQRDDSPGSPFSEDHRRFFNFEDNNIERQRPPLGSPDGHNRSNFNVFTDPLEMHRYFEEQMDNFFRSFGMPNFGSFFHALEHPDLDDHQRSLQEEYSQNPREYFLRKGYEKHYERPDDNIDTDVDGKLNITDLDTLFQSPHETRKDIGPKENHSLKIFGGSRPFGGSFFNQSIQSKTIRNPDGSVETSRTVTDSEGNEETTITQKMGDKEYTVVKRRDKEGKEEISETMINMSEDDKSLFTKVKPTEPFKPTFDEFMFSNFFK